MSINDKRCAAMITTTLRCERFVEHPGPHESHSIAFLGGEEASYQSRIAAWIRSTFGEEAATNVPERALRVAEEALELTQACNVDAATFHRLVDYVFSRPIGEPEQEIAGCMVTLYALASTLGVDVDTALGEEIERIHRPEIIERCRRRQREKDAALVTGSNRSTRPRTQWRGAVIVHVEYLCANGKREVLHFLADPRDPDHLFEEIVQAKESLGAEWVRCP